MTKKALGRGLDALISGGIARPSTLEAPQIEVPIKPFTPHHSAPAPAPAVAPAPVSSEDEVRHIPIDKVVRSPFQPRTEFDPEHLAELAASIKQRGVMQPLLVRAIGAANGERRYELIAGERRWRAAKEAGLTTIPALVREATDQEVLEIALIENLQREDLNAIEEARGFDQLTKQFNLTQEQVAEKVSRSRAAVANALRLLALPEDVQSWIADGRLSVGHAKVILGLEAAAEQRLVAERILRENITVRDTEQLVEQLKTGRRRMGRASAISVKLPEVLAIEEKLQQKLGTRVKLYHGRKKGRIEIEYYGNEDLERLMTMLGVEKL